MIMYARHKPKSLYPCVYLEIELFLKRATLSKAVYYVIGMRDQKTRAVNLQKGVGGVVWALSPPPALF